MRDIWAFLLQTLTATSGAAFLLVIKALFRDKLSPRWQFAIWSLVAAVLLVPAGLGGRYVLLPWPMIVETLKTFLSGAVTFTRVTAPVPLPVYAPEDVWGWLYLLYAIGVILMALRYFISYVRLRWALGRGRRVENDKIQTVAERYDLPVCPAVEVEGLSSAFVCGVFSPVLALPAGVATDEKVILHELLHLKHRDALWGIVICFFRCVHWCNPFLWYCADRAGNDLEALCDQRVLECLEGEERREYGCILLSMANEKYARAPGTTSMANGGRNIRRRIESIARFKKYPSGMALVSICVAIVLAGPMVFGTPVRGVYSGEGEVNEKTELILSLASARTTRCSTVAGALDTYAKSLLSGSGAYRAMCAPAEMQEELSTDMLTRLEEGRFPVWESGLPGEPDNSGRQGEQYYIYNLEFEGNDVYTALLVIPLKATQEVREELDMALAVQNLRVEKEADRWVVIPVDELEYRVCMEESLRWGARDLPTYRYSGTAEDFRIEVHHQKSFVVDNTITKNDPMYLMFNFSTNYDPIPKPDAEFDMVYHSQWSELHYLGGEQEKNQIRTLGLTTYPMEEGEEWPEMRNPGFGDSSGSSNSGEDWSSRKLNIGWESPVHMGGGGTSRDFEGEEEKLPAFYAANFYINSKKVTELSLLYEGGGAK